MELGVWGCTESFFFFFFTDGLKEQPSLMDYFQLRIQISHPSTIVIADCVHTALNLLVHKVYVLSVYYVKASLSVKKGRDTILNTCVCLQH